MSRQDEWYLPATSGAPTDDIESPPPPVKTYGEMVPLEVCNPHDEQGRRRWNVSARKIPRADRDIARSVLTDEDAIRDRGFMAIGSASATPDDDPRFPIGCPASYCLRLTDAEAEQFRGASNAISVVLDRARMRETTQEEGPNYPNDISIP